MGSIIHTPEGIARFKAVAIRGALKLHIATKGQMRVNSAYTPTAVLRTAGNITGKTYKRGQQQAALDDITKLLEAQ